MTINLKSFMQTIGYEFHDEGLLMCALSHRSCGKFNNERLEFLGDSILSFILSAELYQRHPESTEGTLSRIRSALVNGDILASMARDFELNEFLLLGAGERKSGGHERVSILADAFEALIGAIYLDGGIESARKCVLQWYADRFTDLASLQPTKDAKSQLQEWLQAHKMSLPEYEATTSGKAHAQTFHVTCRVIGLNYVTKGESHSRRKAEQLAAKKYLEWLNEQH